MAHMTKRDAIRTPTALPGLLTRGQNFTTVVSAETIQSTREEIDSEFAFVLVDANIRLGPAAEVLFQKLTAKNWLLDICALSAGESIKSETHVRAILNKLSERDYRRMIIIGGGTIINLGNYAAAAYIELKNIRRPDFSLWIAPTNTMSIADVAMGGLGLLNDTVTGTKNALRKTIDPNFIILDSSFITSSSADVQREGVAETVKHCLLQNSTNYHNVLSLWTGSSIEPLGFYNAACLGLELKADVLRHRGQFESRHIGLALNYGHLHATALEEYLSFKVPHGDVVAIGLALDLYLAAPRPIAAEFAAALSQSAIKPRLVDILNRLQFPELLAEYRKDRRFLVGDDFNIISLDTVGQYSLNEDSAQAMLKLTKKTFHEITLAYEQIHRYMTDL